MADDAATLRAAALKMGVELPPGDKSTDSEAHAFAKSLERGGVGGQMSAGYTPRMAVPMVNAPAPWAPNAGWDNTAPAHEPLPPPRPPRPRLALPFVNAPPAWMPNGGYDNRAPQAEPLPPPKPPPPGTYVMGPNGPEPIAQPGGLMAAQPHCECKEPKT